MQIINFPLICWQLNEEITLGRLVGTEFQLVAPSSNRLHGQFSSYLQKQLKTQEVYFLELEEYHLKTYPLSLKAHYQERGKIYPLQSSIPIEVAAIYGPNSQGFYECYLPLFSQGFYYYHPKDLDKLAPHFAQDALRGQTPEELGQHLLVGTPWLEMLPVKVPPRNKPRQSSSQTIPDSPTLLSIGDRLPIIGQKSKQIIPQRAWMRGSWVTQAADALVEENQSVLMVGNPGVGKSAVLTEVVRHITQQQKASKERQRHQFWRSSPTRMVAKARYLGEWQMICEEVAEELSQRSGILWLEDFVSLISVGGEGPEDSMAAFITPLLRQGSLQLMGEMSSSQVDVARRLLPGFLDHFKIIELPEMDNRDTRSIGDFFNESLQQRFEVSFSPDALDLALDLLHRFVRYDRFPGKLIRFLGHCAQQALLAEQQRVGYPEVIQQFTEQTGMPALLLRDDLPLDEAEIRTFFQQRIKGQDHVIEYLISIIRVFKAGLNDPDKPIASLIFAGPTGVGKTATAKALADFLFGLGQRYQPFIRMDMSEFQHPGQIDRLIGSQGKLVQHIRQHPFGVVLLDEIEKAHPVIFDALLTVLDEGMLIDELGRTTDFRDSLIIMTTNLGAKQRKSLGYAPQEVDSYEADIQGFFRPEFVNRIDRVLPFRALDETTIREISLIELNAIAQRAGVAQRRLQFHFTETLVDLVAQQGFDSRYGARPLQREVERLIVAPLARYLLHHPDVQQITLTLDYQGETVQIKEV